MADANDEKDTAERGDRGNKRFLGGVSGPIAVVLVLIALGFAVHQVRVSPPEKSTASQAPDIGGEFTLIDHEGRQVTDSYFRQRLMLVFFGYTFCPDICPTALTEITNVLDALGPAGEKVVPVFITIDPERDTPAHLKEYLSYFHPRTIGLTGSPEQVAKAAKAYKVYYKKSPSGGADEGDYLMDHTSIVYLMGPDGKFLTHFSHGTNADAMAAKLRDYL